MSDDVYISSGLAFFLNEFSAIHIFDIDKCTRYFVAPAPYQADVWWSNLSSARTSSLSKENNSRIQCLESAILNLTGPNRNKRSVPMQYHHTRVLQPCRPHRPRHPLDQAPFSPAKSSSALTSTLDAPNVAKTSTLLTYSTPAPSAAATIIMPPVEAAWSDVFSSLGTSSLCIPNNLSSIPPSPLISYPSRLSLMGRVITPYNPQAFKFLLSFFGLTNKFPNLVNNLKNDFRIGLPHS